jgi:hypothetical protein
MRNSNFGGVLLSSLTELSYSAYQTPIAPNIQQFPYLSLDVLAATTLTGHDRLFFEPPYQEPLTGNLSCRNQGPSLPATWKNWDALNGCWWDNNGELGFGGLGGVQPLSVYITAHADAKIVNYTGLGGLRLAVGFASMGDTFDGNVDLVTVGVGGTSVSYDFEPPPVCNEADGNGEFQSQNGQRGNFSMDNDNCEESGRGGNGDTAQGDRVTSSNRGDGATFNSTQIQSTKFDSKAHTITITGVGTSNGKLVAFTLVALETGIGVPGWVSLAFSDGYSIAGNLLNGSVTLH